MKTAKRALMGAVVVFALLFLDQVTKLLAQYYLSSETGVSVIPGLISLTYYENDAIAFGIGSGNQPFMITVMIATPLIVIGMGALFFTVFKKNLPAQVILAIIAAGALGNFVDRLFVFNAEGIRVVRDFIGVVKFLFIPGYACNVADIYIVLGAIAFVFVMLFIGPQSMFPLTKKWREEAKRIEAEREAKKNGFMLEPAEKEPVRASKAEESAFEEVVIFDNSGKYSKNETSEDDGTDGQNG